MKNMNTDAIYKNVVSAKAIFSNGWENGEFEIEDYYDILNWIYSQECDHDTLKAVFMVSNFYDEGGYIQMYLPSTANVIDFMINYDHCLENFCIEIYASEQIDEEPYWAEYTKTVSAAGVSEWVLDEPAA